MQLDFTTVTLPEEWRPVPDFPAYAVSSYGRVRRVLPCKTRRVGGIFTTRIGKSRYLRVSLQRNNCPFSQSVHKLVALAFHGPQPPGHVVNHRDGNKVNNTASNNGSRPKKTMHMPCGLGFKYGLGNTTAEVESSQRRKFSKSVPSLLCIVALPWLIDLE